MRSLRRFVIVVAELLQIVSLAVWTFAGSWAGGYLARVIPVQSFFSTNFPPETFIDAGRVLGGIVGFAIAVTGAAVVFAVAQIEINAREVGRYYADRRKSEAAIERAMTAERRP